MEILINTDNNISASAEMRSYLIADLEASFERFAEHLTRLEVKISDENGSKEGDKDKKCVLEAVDKIATSKRKFWYSFNRAGNFFKHGDRDPEGVLSGVPEEENEALISLAVEIYRDLGGSLTPEIESFYLWWRSINFESIGDAREPFISWLNENADRIHTEDRSKLTDIGKSLLSDIKASNLSSQ